MSLDSLGHKFFDFLCIFEHARTPRVTPGGLRYFHLGHTKKIQEKKLFNFLLATKLPFMHPFSKSWSVLISAKSGQFEFAVRFNAILGDFVRFSQKNEKIDHVFFAKPA